MVEQDVLHKEILSLDSSDWSSIKDLADKGQKAGKELGNLFSQNQEEVEFFEGDQRSIEFRSKKDPKEQAIAIHNHPKELPLPSETDFAAKAINGPKAFEMLNITHHQGVCLFLGTSFLPEDSQVLINKQKMMTGQYRNLDMNDQLGEVTQWEVVLGEQKGQRFHRFTQSKDLKQMNGLSVLKREDAVGRNVHWMVFIPWQDLDQALQKNKGLTFRRIAFADGLPELMNALNISSIIPTHHSNLVEALT